MCGIIGAVAQRDVAPVLLEGLKRLEYRGYDSAGLAVIDSQHVLQRYRALGKVKELEKLVQKELLPGNMGIAHTRWATHGKPSEGNAHPHISSGEIALVHNGIIENYEELGKRLLEQGYNFDSETDSEIAVHLVHFYLQKTKDFLKAVTQAQAELIGAFAIGFISTAEPERLIAVRRGSPLVVGIGIGEHFIASDHLALLPFAQKFIYLEEGDIVDLRRNQVTIYDQTGQRVERTVHTSELSHEMTNKGRYRHYMLKEIFEQPHALAATLEDRLTHAHVIETAFGKSAETIFAKIKRVQIVACGTSYHAGLVTRYWLGTHARIPCQVEVASEFRYREPFIESDTLLVTLSQSGETADTLGALRAAKNWGYAATLAICNVAESALVRESDMALITAAGPEIGVASTKAFTTQLAAALLLTLAIGRHHHITPEIEMQWISQLQRLPHRVEQALMLDKQLKALADHFANKHHALFLGRGVYYPIALEGALKLKEISYIHAEAYPAGELKHGPLALVDEKMPVIALAPDDKLLDKIKSNLQEVRARGGELIVFADAAAQIASGPGIQVINMPKVESLLAPIVYTIPLQLLAYYTAVIKGTDVDQPRNLAKSVTVE